MATKAERVEALARRLLLDVEPDPAKWTRELAAASVAAAEWADGITHGTPEGATPRGILASPGASRV